MKIKKRIGCIDCVRAICALWIAGFWHLFEYIDSDIDLVNPVTEQITSGVLATFTFISGYFLGKKEIKNIKSVVMFYLERWISFYSLFFMSCTLLWHIGYIETTKQYVTTIVGLAGIITPATITVWYMCMLMLFYLITPLVSLHQGRGRVVFGIVIWILLILAVIFAEIDRRWSFYWFFYCVGILYPKGDNNKKINYKNPLFVFCVFSFAIIVGNLGNMVDIIGDFICASCIIVILFNIGRILEKTRMLKLMMRISYAGMCIYLFHRPFYFYVKRQIGTFSILQAYFMILPILGVLCYGIQYCYDRYIKNKCRLASVKSE